MKVLQVFEKAKEGSFQTSQFEQGTKKFLSPLVSIWDVWKAYSYLEMRDHHSSFFVLFLYVRMSVHSKFPTYKHLSCKQANVFTSPRVSSRLVYILYKWLCFCGLYSVFQAKDVWEQV